jgi:undecaprenyl-diphosphatase
MQIIDSIILGLVQGITEFIPVSSSGHLLVIGHWLNFRYSGLAFDTALDIGTLLALLLFFAKDFVAIIHDVLFGGPQRRLGWLIVAATIPGVIIGIIIQHAAETIFRSTTLVAFNLIWVGLLMWGVDRWSKSNVHISGINLPKALTVGVAQALALVPGVSRSGITISASRMLGLDRVSATKFSFLMSAPIIAGATAKVLLTGTALNEMSANPAYFVLGILAAFVSGYLAIKFMLSYLSRHGLAVFAWYRVAFGILILLVGIK